MSYWSRTHHAPTFRAGDRDVVGSTPTRRGTVPDRRLLTGTGDDLLWYRPGGEDDHVWWSAGGRFSSTTSATSGRLPGLHRRLQRRPLRRHLLVRALVRIAVHIWLGGASRTFRNLDVTVNGGLLARRRRLQRRPGRGRLLVPARRAPTPSGSARSTGASWDAMKGPTGRTQPFAGDFDGDGRDRRLLVRPRHPPDAIWGARSGKLLRPRVDLGRA